MSKILLVEDDEAISDFYSESLDQAGFVVTTTNNSEDALRSFKTSQFDLVILDIVLGDDTQAGFKICTEIRALSQYVPVIFLTSLDSDMEKISGMLLDANDYITKNVSIEYLIIRIKALLRRTSILTGTNKSIKENKTNELSRGDLYINMDTLTTKWKDKSIKLNLTQLWMIHALVMDRGCMRTSEQLMEAANIVVQPNSIVAHIRSMRRLFQAVDPEFSAIQTVRGIGYRWVVDEYNRLE